MTAESQHDLSKVCFITFGCQMNKLDSELAGSAFIRAGFTLTDSLDEAGAIIVNTCSVRKHAEERALMNVARFRRAKKDFPELVVAIMGCMAQKDGEALLAVAPNVDIVCGTKQFARLPELVERVRAERGRYVLTGEADVEVNRLATARPEKHRAFLSILRGCNSFCTYCIVPYVRGRETSRPMDEIVDEAQKLVDDGVAEITLLGQNIDAYNYEGHGLADLLERVDKVRSLKRLRFVTSHPKDISIKLLDAMARLPRVCAQLHMPAQSGSDRILKAMNRGYTSDKYREIVRNARERMPLIEIASDFIVGFPGETEEDFQATVSLVRECQFNQSFIFKFSPREGTPAANMPDDVPTDVKERRNHELLAVQESVSRERQRGKIGRIYEVMADGPSKRKPDRIAGRTRGHDIVVFEKPAEKIIVPGDIVNVKIVESTPLTLHGTLEN